MVVVLGYLLLVFEIFIDLKYFEGEYMVEFVVRCFIILVLWLRKFKVFFGVLVVFVFFEKDYFYLNDIGYLYIILMFVRNVNLIFVVSYYNENWFVKNMIILVIVVEGIQVVRVLLLIEILGNYIFRYQVYFFGVGIGGGEVYYIVLSFLSIVNVSVVRDEKGIVFNIWMYNLDLKKLGVFFYNVIIDGIVFYLGFIIVDILLGSGLVVFIILLDIVGYVVYNFILKVFEYIFLYFGVWVFFCV